MSGKSSPKNKSKRKKLNHFGEHINRLRQARKLSIPKLVEAMRASSFSQPSLSQLESSLRRLEVSSDQEPQAVQEHFQNVFVSEAADIFVADAYDNLSRLTQRADRIGLLPDRAEFLVEAQGELERLQNRTVRVAELPHQAAFLTTAQADLQRLTERDQRMGRIDQVGFLEQATQELAARATAQKTGVDNDAVTKMLASIVERQNRIEVQLDQQAKLLHSFMTSLSNFVQYFERKELEEQAAPQNPLVTIRKRRSESAGSQNNPDKSRRKKIGGKQYRPKTPGIGMDAIWLEVLKNLDNEAAKGIRDAIIAAQKNRSTQRKPHSKSDKILMGRSQARIGRVKQRQEKQSAVERPKRRQKTSPTTSERTRDKG